MCVCVCVCVCAGEGGALLMLVVFPPPPVFFFFLLVCCNARVFMTDRYVRCVVLVSGAFITTLSALSLFSRRACDLRFSALELH